MPLSDYLPETRNYAATVADTIAGVLRTAILDGALEGGMVLRQEDIAKQFGVSRVPIREALLKLEGQGLVETQPRRGVVVTMLSAAEFAEILEMRLSLECLALDLAAPAFTEADLKGALEIVDRTQSEINRTKVLDLRDEFESRWGHLNWEFHRRLYAPANRPRLLSTIENLNLLFARHLRARIARQDQTGVKSTTSNEAAANLAEWTAVLEEHRSMAIACGKHDAKAAKVILRRHISDHGAELVGRLRAISKDIASL